MFYVLWLNISIMVYDLWKTHVFLLFYLNCFFFLVLLSVVIYIPLFICIFIYFVSFYMKSCFSSTVVGILFFRFPFSWFSCKNSRLIFIQCDCVTFVWSVAIFFGGCHCLCSLISLSSVYRILLLDDIKILCCTRLKSYKIR